MNEANWHWNAMLFQMIHGSADSPAWLIRAGRLLTDAPLVPAALLALWMVWRHDDARTAVRLGLACIIVACIERLVGMYFSQPRPFAAGMGVSLLPHVANNAMPSTHVGLMWAAAVLALLGRHARVAAGLFVLGLATAWARIYVGLQWPADIAASALCACVAAAGSFSLEQAAGCLVRTRPDKSSANARGRQA